MEKRLALHMSTKDLPRRYKELKKKANNPIKKWPKILNRYAAKGNIQAVKYDFNVLGYQRNANSTMPYFYSPTKMKKTNIGEIVKKWVLASWNVKQCNTLEDSWAVS